MPRTSTLAAENRSRVAIPVASTFAALAATFPWEASPCSILGGGRSSEPGRDQSRNPVIPEGTTVPAEFSPSEGLAWIEREWGRADKGEGLSLAIAFARSGEALGAGVLLFRRQPLTAEIGYWLIPRARGRGLGSGAVALLARWAVTDAGLARVEALVTPDNVVSQRVLEKAGFRREGLLRSYLVFDRRRADAFIYSLLPSDLA